MLDVIQMLMTMVNLKAAMIGVAAAQAWNFFTPSTADNPFATAGGGWRARVAPIVSPIVASIACVALEWDRTLLSDDIARGILSGFASEFMLRIWYKTIKGI
jgi:hypothetical protein